MSGKHSRNKGANFERWVANELKRIWPDAKRGLQQTRDSAEAPDVTGTLYWIECKRGKKVNYRAALKQAEGVCDKQIPVVIAKDDREEPIVYMRLDGWMELAKKLTGRKKH